MVVVVVAVLVGVRSNSNTSCIRNNNRVAVGNVQNAAVVLNSLLEICRVQGFRIPATHVGFVDEVVNAGRAASISSALAMLVPTRPRLSPRKYSQGEFFAKDETYWQKPAGTSEVKPTFRLKHTMQERLRIKKGVVGICEDLHCNTELLKTRPASNNVIFRTMMFSSSCTQTSSGLCRMDKRSSTPANTALMTMSIGSLLHRPIAVLRIRTVLDTSAAEMIQ